MVERSLFKGNSSSEKLYELVVKVVRSLEVKYGFKLLVTHVSGKRMIAQGTDGISRGERIGKRNQYSSFLSLG